MESVLIRCDKCSSVNRVKIDKFNQKPQCSKCHSPLKWTAQPVDVTMQSYQKEVIENPGFTLLEFWSQTCGYCRSMDPIIVRFASEKAGIVKMVKVNSTTEYSIASQFNIMGVPAFILFKGGRMIDQKNGALSKEQLETWIARNLEN
jgi:thioredoxin 2